MKLLNLITLFLFCRLGWIWINQCGADLGLGETLPFCLECSGFVSIIRLLFLSIAIGRIYNMLKYPPEEVQIHDQNINPVESIIIHWHRIILLIALISYPLWIYWIDINTIIPGPDDIFFTKASCIYPGYKGTLLWVVVMIFVTWGFKILHNN